MSASVPDDIAIQQDAVDIWPGRSVCPWKRPDIELVLSRFRIQFHKSGIRADVHMPFPIRLDALSPANRFERELELLEMRACEMVEAEISSYQERSIGSLAKRRSGSGLDPLAGSERLEAFPVISEDPVLGAHPKESGTILIYLTDREIGKPFRDAEIPEAVLLREQGLACERHESEGA